jgi:hypothetical protein
MAGHAKPRDCPTPNGANPIPPAPREELDAILAEGKPVLLTVIGYGGVALIAWLMMSKPF